MNLADADSRAARAAGAVLRDAPDVLLIERLVTIVLLWLVGVSFALVAVMATERAGDPGYDFRYFWLAGRLWAEGISPYGPVFAEAGARLIPAGHVPEIWPYPPNLWLPAVAISPLSLTTAWAVWLVAEVVALAVASAVLAWGLPVWLIPGGQRRPAFVRLAFFCGHLALVATLEATHLAVYVGQSALFIHLGATMLLAGIARGRSGLATAGLVCVCMKPQVGAVVALALLVSGRAGAHIVLRAALVSLLLVLPPMAIRPTVVLDWLQTLGAYDGATLANMAVAMTGLRHLLWMATGWDIGNLSAMAATMAAALAVALWLRDAAARDAAGRVRLLVAEFLVVLAFAPLHMYDFVLFGIGLLALFGARGPRLAAAVVGAAAFVKPTDVHVLLSGQHPTSFFPGSTLATVGALILLAVALAPTRDRRGIGENLLALDQARR
ncbi:MAG: glycosyltransferase 87 family protein [Albidovulum sp.]